MTRILNQITQWLRLFILTIWPNPRATEHEPEPQRPETAPIEPEPPVPAREPPPIEVRAPSPPPPGAATPALIPAPEPPPIYMLPPHRKEKWVTPKPSAATPTPSRTVLHKPEPKPWQPPKPNRERIQLTEDPEQWGQYYFRDAILDQLDRYWIYLGRMKHGDNDAYELLRQVGIQLVPWSATQNFDNWSHGEQSGVVELSPWWRSHRPAFGAIAYGFDNVSDYEDYIIVGDLAEPDTPEQVERRRKIKEEKFGLKQENMLRPVYLTKTAYKNDERIYCPRIVWTPRFLYFNKYAKPPPDFERLTGGDTYAMTVYWDRCDKAVPKRWRKKNHGGVPQTYGIYVERNSGLVRVLRQKIHERVVIKWTKGPYGGRCDEPTEFTHTHWDVPDRYLRWAHRDFSDIEPEDYLRRLFIEAACMYESAVLGSMVRIAVQRGDLVATFGVEIKRMSHFFRDRDVSLTVKGARRPVFHVVRPHIRKTGAEVPMHFRGMREFDWAGYKVSVTVPGLHHEPLPEFDVGMHDRRNSKIDPKNAMNAEKVGKWVVDEIIKKGLGGHQK